MSVPRIAKSKLVLRLAYSVSTIAVVYDSSPDEQPADQTLNRTPPCMDARLAGSTASRRNEKCLGSRKKSVLLVVMALMKGSRSSRLEEEKKYSAYCSTDCIPRSRTRRSSRLCTIV